MTELTFAGHVVLARVRLRLSNAQVADLIGSTYMYVFNLINQRTCPTQSEWDNIVDALGIQTDNDYRYLRAYYSGCRQNENVEIMEGIACG